MNSKQGGALGAGLSVIMASIAITTILLIFIFASGFVKLVSEVKGGTKIYEGSKVGLGDVFSYPLVYLKLVDVRLLVNNGKSVSQAVREVGYGKEGEGYGK